MEEDPGVDQSENLSSACNEPEKELPLAAIAHVKEIRDENVCIDKLPANHDGYVKGGIICARDEDVCSDMLPANHDGSVKEGIICASDEQVGVGKEKNLFVRNDNGNMNTCVVKQVEGPEALSVAKVPTQFFCNTCSVQCTSVKDFETHMSGRRHAKATQPATSASKGVKVDIKLLSEEGLPMENLITSLITKGHSDCVARAMARAFYCPGLGLRALGCPQSEVMGGIMSTDTQDMVEMHSHCLINLLHEVRFRATKDLLWCALTKKESIAVEPSCWAGSLANIPASAPSQAENENTNGSMGRAQHVGKEDLDLILTSLDGLPLVGRTPLSCSACNSFCNSEKDFVQHCKGKKHVARLRLLQSNGKRCREDEEENLILSMEGLCDSDDGGSKGDTLPGSHDGDGKEDMVLDKDHGNRELDAIKLHAKRLKTEPSSVTQAGTPFFCDICSVVCTSAKDLKAHVSGRKHAKAKGNMSATSGSGLISHDKEARMLMIKVPSSTGGGDLKDGVNVHTGQVNVTDSVNVSATGQGSLDQARSLPLGEITGVETKGVLSTGQRSIVNGVNDHVGQGNSVEINSLSSSGQGDLNGLSLAREGNRVDNNGLSSAGQGIVVDINGLSLMKQGNIVENNGLASMGQGGVKINGMLGDGISSHSGQAHTGTSDGAFVGQPVEVRASSLECFDLNEAPTDVHPPSLRKPLDLRNELNMLASNINRSYDVLPTGVNHGSAMVAALLERNSTSENLSSLGSISTTLVPNGGCDCVARATAASHGCPVHGGQVASAHSESQAVGSSHCMAKVHLVCFLNRLHEIWIATIRDLLLHAPRREETPKCGLAGIEKGLERDLVGEKNSDLVSSLWICQVCNLICNSQSALESHYNGKKHMSKLRLLQSKETLLDDNMW